LLAARPGDRVLDLCAAPGGKTVRLAADLENQGLLLSNDINPKRIKALIKNIEISGIINTVVANESPEKLSRAYESYFNKMLLDVPCSGEGMFRKDSDAVKSWNRYKAEELQGLQREIFASAYRMLAPGGTLVYSTCTFNPEENEKNITWFLNTYPDLFLKEIPKQFGMEPGRPEWADGNPELLKTARLWPHKVKGEGHFTALLGRLGEDSNKKEPFVDTEPTKNFRKFSEAMLFHIPRGVYHMGNTELHILPQGYQNTPGLKIVKTGLYVGSEEHGTFEPSQSLIMALRWENLKRKESFSVENPDLYRYLKGETLQREGEKGYIALGVDEFPLGWGKIGDNGLKNLYSKGWRKTR
jgi:NOL1/NOP2/fmu family ribosome biogenesis protein/23S rRNA U2552 (ribose-2'-O)-methylase RlmE/FtsJ